MFDFTLEERRVILFLISMALIGLGIRFAIKVNPRLEKVLKVERRLTKMNLNEVSLEDLCYIKGITPKLASGIIAYRNANGLFKEVEELKEVKGIGDKRYEKLKDLFFVD